MATETSPPAARTRSMTAFTAVSVATGALPSQAGAQAPPWARMNASMNDRWPVADITAPRSGGSLASGMTYGAAAYQLDASAAAVDDRWPAGPEEGEPQPAASAAASRGTRCERDRNTVYPRCLELPARASPSAALAADALPQKPGTRTER